MNNTDMIWNLREIVRGLLDDDGRDDCFDGDRIIRRDYLGTCFGLLPSGKFYCVLSPGNIDVCEVCADACDNSPCDPDTQCTTPEDYNVEEDGEYHCEFCRDQTWIQQSEKELKEIGCCLNNGEGDPCDYFVEIVFDTVEDEQDWIKEMREKFDIKE